MAEQIPNDSVLVRNAQLAVKAALEKKKILQQPVARFDPKTKQVYLEHSDGSITAMGEAMKQGRYSERRK